MPVAIERTGSAPVSDLAQQFIALYTACGATRAEVEEMFTMCPPTPCLRKAPTAARELTSAAWKIAAPRRSWAPSSSATTAKVLAARRDRHRRLG